MSPADQRALARLLEEVERTRYDLRVVVGEACERDRDLDEAIEALDIPRLLLELDPRSGR